MKNKDYVYHFWAVDKDTKKFKGFIKSKNLNNAKEKGKLIDVTIPKQTPIKEVLKNE